MDEVDEDRSVRLKANIFSYFDKASKKTADTDEATTENSVDESGPAPPVLFKVCELIQSQDRVVFCSPYSPVSYVAGVPVCF